MKPFVRNSLKRLVAVGEECLKDGKRLDEVLWCTDTDAITVRGLLNLKRVAKPTPAVKRSIFCLVEIGKACKRCGWKRSEACFSLGFVIGRREKDVNCCITIGDLLNLRYLQ